MQKRFRKNNEQSRNVSTGKSCSCFSALWELNEQQYYSEANNNSAQFRKPVALEACGVEITNNEEIIETEPDIFHGLLAIGTLGSVIITKDPITPKPATDEEDTHAGEQFLKELEEDTKENKNMVVYPLKEYIEIPAVKEDEKEQKAVPEHTFKKNGASYKRAGILGKGVKRETRAFHFMKNMLKKLDFASRCSTVSAFRSNDIICDSTEKTPTKVFRKSRKIHPETAEIHINMSHKYEVKKMCYDESYDKEAASDDEDDMYYQDAMFKKETISSNIQPTGRKAHWIKTDADCKYTCIISRGGKFDPFTYEWVNLGCVSTFISDCLHKKNS
ncbi:putative protein LAZY1 [Helianthus debilis subsp. tardiflorus]